MNKLVLYLLCCFSLVSCEEKLMDSSIPEENAKEEMNNNPLLIDKEKVNLSSIDAENVATLFSGKQPRFTTKGMTERQIKETLPICDSLNNPVMYAINYQNNQGFVIVSSTKKYAPILAYSEEGNFHPDNSDGSQLWMGVIRKLIEKVKDDPEAPLSFEWIAYEQNREPLTTRAFSYQTIDWWRDEMIHDIKYSGLYDEDPLNEKSRGEKTGEEFLNYDEMVHMLGRNSDLDEIARQLEYAGYNDPNLAIFHVKYYSHSTTKEKLLKTYWHQKDPYNKFCPTNCKVGCVPVAIGQIMNYFKWPADFADWNTIANETNNPSIILTATPSLLSKIGQEIGMVYGKEQSYPKWWEPLNFGDLSQVKNFFREHQYSVSKKPVDGNLRLVAEEIQNNKPVYMEGTQELFHFLGIRIPSFKAHSWVCDGYTYYGSGKVWAVYLPRNYNPRPDAPLDENPYEPYSGYEYGEGDGSIEYFHMNWGWGKGDNNNDNGLHQTGNGWFRNADISVLDKTNFTVLYRFIAVTPNK